jgi:hypothetical protein
MAGLADVARFRSDDPDELVLAALVCPVCLHGDEIEWRLDLEADGYDPSARCECRHCDQSWRVYMTPYQALRLSLMTVHTA